MQRNIAPEIKIDTDFEGIIPELIQHSDSDLKLFIVSGGREEVFRLECLFPFGEAHLGNPVLPGLMLDLLGEGIPGKSASEIHFALDSLGAVIQKQAARDHILISVSGRNSNFFQILDWFYDIISRPVFPENEIKRMLDQEKTSFRIQQKQVLWQARQAFKPLLFGDHPYNLIIQESHFNGITTEMVQDVCASLLYSSVPVLFMSGKIEASQSEAVLHKFSGWQVTKPAFPALPRLTESRSGKNYIPVEDALQTALIMAGMAPAPHEVGYPEYRLLTTLFGGYFGSRLMKNIREEKGYTYGIGAGITDTGCGSFMFIQTEVGAEVTRATLDEINLEMKKLREELVEEEELEIVKNYISGAWLRAMDGPFRQAVRLRNLYIQNRTPEQDRAMYAAIRAAGAAELQEAARKWLNPEQFVIGAAGPLSAGI